MVRVAVVGSALDYRWPRRWLRCGAREFLVPSTCRVGRAKVDWSGLGVGFAKRTAVMTMSVPMCQRRADADDAWRCTPADTAASSTMTWSGRAVRGGRPDGLAAIWWADRNAAVWPMQFDPDVSVLKIRIADERYAEDFRQANPVDTSARTTAPPPWYERSTVWVIGVVALLFWLAR